LFGAQGKIWKKGLFNFFWGNSKRVGFYRNSKKLEERFLVTNSKKFNKKLVNKISKNYFFLRFQNFVTKWEMKMKY